MERIEAAKEQWSHETNKLRVEIEVLLERLRAREREISELNVMLLKYSDYKTLRERIKTLERINEEQKIRIEEYMRQVEELRIKITVLTQQVDSLETWKRNHRCPVVEQPLPKLVEKQDEIKREEKKVEVNVKQRYEVEDDQYN